jgi:adenylate cyclase
MSDVFISYSRSTEPQARRIAEALRGAGHDVWRDDELPAHRDYSEVIEERLRGAKAVVVIWSAAAVKSQWVRAEADLAREADTLVQLSLDGSPLPMPFNRIQCADLSDWAGDLSHPGWKKVAASVAELANGHAETIPAAAAPTSAVQPAPTISEKPSIAVLPFTDLSPAKDQDYFCDGMVVEIVTALSRFRTLFVIASGSSLTYRDVTGRLPQTARELGVRYLLEGSVRKAGDRVRIAAHLIDAHDSAREVWAERFDGTLEDVFALQDEVAGAVASRIEPTIVAIETRRASARPTGDVTAYDLYLRGMKALGRFTKAGHAEALALCAEAIARDPNYAEALAISAFAYTNRMVLGWSDDLEDDRRRALDLRSRALSARSDDPEVISTVAAASMQLGVDPAGALASAERALARHPGSSTVQMTSGFVFLYAGEAAAALAGLEASQRLDPLSTWRQIVLFTMAFANLFLKRFEAVIPLAHEAGELMPELRPYTASITAAALGHLGRRGEARAALAGVDVAAQGAILAGFAPQDRDTVLAGIAMALAEG